MHTQRPRALASRWALLIVVGRSSPQRDLGQTGDGEMREMEGGGEECAASGRANARDAARVGIVSDAADLWIGPVEAAPAGVPRDPALPSHSFPPGTTRIVLEITHAEPIFARLDPAGSGTDEPDGTELAPGGEIVLAFSLSPGVVSKLHARLVSDAHAVSPGPLPAGDE